MLCLYSKSSILQFEYTGVDNILKYWLKSQPSSPIIQAAIYILNS